MRISDWISDVCSSDLLRAQLTPSWRGKRPATDAQSTDANADRRTPDEKRRAMTSATAPCVALGRCSRRGSTSSIHGKSRDIHDSTIPYKSMRDSLADAYLKIYARADRKSVV